MVMLREKVFGGASLKSSRALRSPSQRFVQPSVCRLSVFELALVFPTSFIFVRLSSLRPESEYETMPRRSLSLRVETTVLMACLVTSRRLSPEDSTFPFSSWQSAAESIDPEMSTTQTISVGALPVPVGGLAETHMRYESSAADF
jgi:hypothetical protein